MNKNRELADIFENIAEILEFKGENIFKIKAYRRAALIISELSCDITELWRNKELDSIEGVGKSIAEKIDEYLRTGKLEKYSSLIAETPRSLLDLLKIQNLGPRTLFWAHEKLGVNNLEDLEKAIEDGSIMELPGMGEKKVENIKSGISLYKSGKGRVSIGLAMPVVNDLVDLLQPFASMVSPAGSFRRMQETVGDIDILVVSSNPEKLIKAFTGHSSVKEINAEGTTKASVIISKYNLQVDLRVVSDDSYGAALQYFTGSTAHNVKIRGMAAREKGLKINEYGVFQGERKVAGSSEDEVYSSIGLPFIPPELRENRGEIEAAMKGTLPELIVKEDIKGDIHTHSNYSDGINDIRTLAESAREKGYRYIGICDHSKSSRIAGGMDEDKLRRRNEEIDKLREEIRGIEILKGIEVDILSDGTLDYDDSVLEGLDYVIAAIHQGFQKNAGERMKAAVRHPLVDIIAHPTGRLISGRKGYELDIDEILDYASGYNVVFEINSHYDRLDLNDSNILKGRTKGLKFLISTDLHDTGMFDDIKLGIGIARRGWLKASDVVNTYEWKDMPLRSRSR